MKIFIPGNPISVNKLYRGRRHLTPEGKAIKYMYAAEAYNQYKGSPITGPVSIFVRATFTDHRKHDLDNVLKALLDAMKGILWIDDDQIDEIVAVKSIGPKPLVEIWARKSK